MGRVLRCARFTGRRRRPLTAANNGELRPWDTGRGRRRTWRSRTRLGAARGSSALWGTTRARRRCAGQRALGQRRARRRDAAGAAGRARDPAGGERRPDGLVGQPARAGPRAAANESVVPDALLSQAKANPNARLPGDRPGRLGPSRGRGGAGCRGRLGRIRSEARRRDQEGRRRREEGARRVRQGRRQGREGTGRRADEAAQEAATRGRRRSRPPTRRRRAQDAGARRRTPRACADGNADAGARRRRTDLADTILDEQITDRFDVDLRRRGRPDRRADHRARGATAATSPRSRRTSVGRAGRGGEVVVRADAGPCAPARTQLGRSDGIPRSRRACRRSPSSTRASRTAPTSRAASSPRSTSARLPNNSPGDGRGHGTFVAGIAAGASERYTGHRARREARLDRRARRQRHGPDERRDPGRQWILDNKDEVQHPRRELLAALADLGAVLPRSARPGRRAALVQRRRRRRGGRQLRHRRPPSGVALQPGQRPVRDHRRRGRPRHEAPTRATTASRRGRPGARRSTAS